MDRVYVIEKTTTAVLESRLSFYTQLNHHNLDCGRRGGPILPHGSRDLAQNVIS